jgi:hypothetical protein
MVAGASRPHVPATFKKGPYREEFTVIESKGGQRARMRSEVDAK